ncbi:MAG: hypothetical protein HY820_17875 [Acidobacteria bacterium]|nr:hypothetical protein [Acidobacteriota bacterium]
MMISIASVTLLLLAFAPPVIAQTSNGVTTIQSVEPVSGKTGDVMKVTGAYLDKQNISALYLTNGAVDIKVVIVEQTATMLRFRIPAEAKPGRFALMVLVGKGSEEKLLEQPVKITVLAGDSTVT